MIKISIQMTGLCRALLLAGALSLVACEPSPEERVARAEGYMADADYRAAILELKNASRANPDYAVARLLLGEASYQVGDLPTAETEYERALGLGEDRPEVWVALGRTLLEMGRAEDAFERVVPNLGDVSDVEAVHVLKGDVLSVLGNREEATMAYDVALGINSQSAGALIGIAVLAAAAQEYDRAREFIERAAAADPDSTTVWRAKGDYLAVRGEHSGAANAYARSISVETRATPSFRKFLTRVNRTTALVDSRRINEAERQLSELQEKYPSHPILRYLAGRIAFINGDYDAAQLELQEYLAKMPRDARGQALLGAVHFSQDNLRQAEMYLGQAVRANAGGDATRRLLAETLLRLNKPEEALTELQPSQAIAQQDPMLLAMLGRAEIGVGETEEAIRYFEQGIAADPGNPALVLALAVAYLQGDRADAAIRVLEMMPDAPGSPYRREALLIGAYLREGLRNKAIDRGNDLLRRSPADPRVFALVGVLNNTIGNTERAEEIFGKALQLDPDNLGALMNLGTMAYSKEDFARSAQLFDRLLDVNPAHVAGLVWMAAALQREQRLAELRPRLMTAIHLAPGSLEPRVLLARLELAEGKPEAALAQVAAARDHFPDETGLDHLEGRILLQQDRTREALKSLERAVTAMPDHATYVFDLASVQLSNGDFDAAAQTVRVYRNLRPQDVRGLSLYVDAKIRAGAPQRAMSEVDEFLANNPDVAAAHLLAGDVQLANGSPREALAHYEMAASKEWTRRAAFQIARARNAAGVRKAAEPLSRVLSENPEDADARFLYAQLLEAAGDVDRAVGEYEHLLADGKLPAIGLNNLAWQYFLQGRSEAVELAQEAHNLDPENGSITDTLGWILFNTGETERAVRLLREAVIQSPSNAAIQDHLNFALAEK